MHIIILSTINTPYNWPALSFLEASCLNIGYRIRQNIREGKLSRFINNMHYVGKTFADCRLKLRARLCNVDLECAQIRIN